MARGLKIPKRKKDSITEKIKKYDKPKYVYIPLICQNDTNITVLVKQGDYVCKGDVIARRRGHFKVPIHASVSGKVISFEEKLYITGQEVKCVVIENDFKELVSTNFEVPKQINHYTKEEFINIIKDSGIVGLGGGGFPTYAKYETNDKINTLIINALECEPYITADYMLIKEKCEEILEAIDAVLNINDIPEAIIAVNKKNTEVIEIFNTFIGTYIKIKLVPVPNIYPMGWERSLIKQVKGVTYNKIPIEKGIVVNNVSTMYAIYEALKYGKPMIERIMTITGDMIKEPQNILIKVGTPVKEIINSIGGYQEGDVISLIAGGPMMGVAVPSDELITSSNLLGIVLMSYVSDEPPTECLRCGKCVEVCPAKLSPVLIMDNFQDSDKLTDLRPKNCVECGLCSYICPAKIRVREFVIRAKEKV